MHNVSCQIASHNEWMSKGEIWKIHVSNRLKISRKIFTDFYSATRAMLDRCMGQCISFQCVRVFCECVYIVCHMTNAWQQVWLIGFFPMAGAFRRCGKMAAQYSMRCPKHDCLSTNSKRLSSLCFQVRGIVCIQCCNGAPSCELKLHIQQTPAIDDTAKACHCMVSCNKCYDIQCRFFFSWRIQWMQWMFEWPVAQPNRKPSHTCRHAQEVSTVISCKRDHRANPMLSVWTDGK